MKQKHQDLKQLSKVLRLKFLESIPVNQIDPSLVAKVPINFAKKYQVLPISRDERFVTVATANPTDTYALDDLRLLFQQPIRMVVSDPEEILNSINEIYEKSAHSAAQTLDGIDPESLDSIAQELEGPKDLLETADEAPVIRLINSILHQAVKNKSSDIHIEPYEKDLVIRHRIDGILHTLVQPSKRLQPLIISRVKIMAGLNIAEKRRPQDGRIRIVVGGREIDIRVSVVPTAFGERVVMRLLDKTTVLLGLEEIGLSGDNLHQFARLIHQNHGILLVTGPTGSGKTTTLYAAISRINTPEKNIITIEDPIEYQLQGIGQIPVNPKINLTFATGLRSILRQDPDVIMVGEIRDQETAEIAIQASLTGHLVFSTLHTNDSAGAVTRLVDMGIEPFLVSSSVLAVLAQRLVRVICPACKQPYRPEKEEILEIGLDPDRLRPLPPFFRGTGCDACMTTGYKGRSGIFELMTVDDSLRSMITKNIDSTTLKKAALARGMMLLQEDGAKKVISGVTTVEEILRVTQEEI